WSNKGAALFLLGRYDEAIFACDMAIEIDPQFAGAWDNRGQVLYELGRYDEALQALNRSIELDPQLMDAWINKASVLKALSRTEEANAAMTKARELGHKDRFKTEIARPARIFYPHTAPTLTPARASARRQGPEYPSICLN